MPAMRDGKTPDKPERVRSRKHTRCEVERIVHFTAALVAGGLRKGDVKEALRGEYGIHYRQAEVYLSRARALLRDQLDIDAEEHRAGALAFYKSVVADQKARIREKLWALDSIVWLLGLAAPFRVDSRTVKADVDHAAMRDLRRVTATDPKLAELVALMAERLAGFSDARPDGSLPEHDPPTDEVEADRKVP
jgi:hypothetical protein